jgi:hypothetical protein
MTTQHDYASLKAFYNEVGTKRLRFFVNTSGFYNRWEKSPHPENALIDGS